jgi:chemotaxis protein MotB
MRFAIPWSRPADGGDERHRLSAVLLLSLLVVSTGCVTRSTHDQVVGDLTQERDLLQNKVTDLERSNRSLGDERAKLLESMEDIRLERERLSRDVAKLEKTKALLSEHLRERESQVQELSKLETTYRGLVNDLESEVSSGQIEIEQLREGIRLNLAQDILFRSGKASLEPSGRAVLSKVSTQLEKSNHTIEVQGHTDDVPLSRGLEARWGSNWELASARAASVVRLFHKNGIDPGRLTVLSRGEFDPVASNDTPEGRARNRRIEIRLRPLEGPVETPAADTSEMTPAPGT